MNRVWIYQADRFLSDEEVTRMSASLNDFISQWAAHGAALAARGYIKYNLFLILEVDERQASASGCSIDSSVRFIKSLEQTFGVGFFDRMKVSFKDTSGAVRLVGRNEFEGLVRSGEVTAETVVFNNLIQQGEELLTNWEVPFRESWHSKVF
ncbi:ABC transporter ATPase [Parapusillimonas sp. SGNA-6]|uniref:ABC transporter ATPase n=1 Tax=Parapedobacter sp. SGR-10 TaxID=2710879 RepID=UPI0013D7A85F|nr:ABC transporter ATPase [Parapedobacter sp. SGR-10]NGF57659.1 ABC transporter ATPase [Parapedobacter sp. SGR-10]NGM90120.1 ABC transporter ATPase [Parapusillimonas sp. SGNA-6]